MQYRLGKKIIPSELAAKPPSQASSYLVQLLRTQEHVAHAVDYGCGKLKYAPHLARFSDDLTIVDSPRQLDRFQRIDGTETTVREMALHLWRHVRIETVEEFGINQRPKFDFALCANVLSAIPVKAARSRALHAIRLRLKSDGLLLVVNQHTNSCFTQFARRSDTRKHLDGWLVLNGRSSSYYGILDRVKIAALLRNSGYELIRQWIQGQSNYALATCRQ